MDVVLAITVGALYGGGFYLMLRRNLIQLILGLVLLGHGANLLIFTLAGLTPGRPPLIPKGQDAPPQPYADPLPQALILTAIVIGFGVLAYALILIKRVYLVLETDDTDAMTGAEQ